MANAKWNSFPALTAATLDDADLLPVSDDSQPSGSKDATISVSELRNALGGGIASSTITAIEALTQAEYDLLAPDADTLYIITDA